MPSKQKTILQKVEKLHSLFHKGDIPTLDQHEVRPTLDKGDRVNYVYFTLPVSINFQRSSPAMWRAALATYEDVKTNYLFYPEKVVSKTREQIQRDLVRHKLALQKNKHTDIWIAISRTLNTHFKNDPREIIKMGGNDAEKIIQLLQVDLRDNFPYLKGNKLAHYWLYILLHFTDIQLTNTHRLSVIPDTHVIQSTIVLGMVDHDASQQDVINVWNDLLSDSHLNPVDMHAVLWNWSRNNFKPTVQ